MNIAIVGHGASVKRLAHLIDAADAVVRFFDCWWQPPEDFGTRYDYGVLRNIRSRMADAAAYASDGRLRTPAKGWWVYDFLGWTAREYRGVPTEVMPSRLFEPHLRGQPLIMRLSRGAAAAIYALAVHKPARLDLYGFDNVMAGQLESQYPPEYPHEIVTKDTKNYHDFALERRTILDLAGETKVFHNGEPL